jgi:hypothetical protein
MFHSNPRLASYNLTSLIEYVSIAVSIEPTRPGIGCTVINLILFALFIPIVLSQEK